MYLSAMLKNAATKYLRDFEQPTSTFNEDGEWCRTSFGLNAQGPVSEGRSRFEHQTNDALEEDTSSK